MSTIKKWIDARKAERTSWDGAILIALGLMVMFLALVPELATMNLKDQVKLYV